MSFVKAALGCALFLPLTSIACGGTQAEPDGADAGPTRQAPDAKPKDDATEAPDGSTTKKGQVDGASNMKVAPPADARAKDAEGDAPHEAAAPLNHGEASTTYPAFTPFMPQVQYGGGPVLSNAEIVTISWYGDTGASTFESFGDDIGSSDYWAQTTSEYNVGPAVSGPTNHVRLPASEAPIASWADVDIATWVTDHVSSPGTYGWPAPTNNTVYVLYLSPSTDVLYDGSSACTQGIGGYHSNVVVDGSDIAYAVVLQCPGGSSSETTASASHELIESATDPHPQDITAWIGFDSDHLAWDVFQDFQDELGDACEFYFDSFFDETFAVVDTPDAGADAGEGGVLALFDAGTTTFAVQRTWSNLHASQGHAPCRPTDYTVYFNVSPLQLDPTVSINLSSQGGASNLQGQGYRVAKGATRTFPIGFWSDGPTNGPWTVSASEGNPLVGGSQTSHLTISIDKDQGQNGDIAYVTVTVNAVDTSMNGELITIASQLSGFHRTFMPILISNE